MTGKHITWRKEEVKLKLIKTKQPSMTEHRGRTWDFGWLLINGKKTQAWLDTTWGDYLYFVWKNSWYKVRMGGSQFTTGTPDYDLDPFATEHLEITIENS